MTAHWKSFLAPILVPPVLILISRIFLQGYLFPIELSGDEAQYWDWSRNLQLSYHTKGPLIAWFIAVSTTLLGNTEFAIRLCSFIAHFIAGIAVGFLGFQLSGGSRRFTWLTAIGFQCIFAYQVAGSLTTVDMTMVAGWSIATSAAVAVGQRIETKKSIAAALILIGLGISIAFLAKYTALLGLVGICMGLWPQRKKLLKAEGSVSGLAFATIILIAGLAPVVLWNAERGWPTIQHLLGHLEIPKNDHDPRNWSDLNFGWPLIYLLQILTVSGPLITLSMILGIHQNRHFLAKNDHRGFRVAFWSAMPVLIFYFLVSFKGETEGNWAVGSLASLIPFAAAWFEVRLNSPFGYWLSRLIVVRATLTLLLILTFPWSGAALQKELEKYDSAAVIPLHRVQGHRQFATTVRRISIDAIGPDAAQAPIVCNYYDLTAIMAFSLPEQPVVYCASSSLGSRPSGYDDFEETRFPQQHHIGKDLILIGAHEQLWRDHMQFSLLEKIGSAIQRGRPRAIFHGKLKSLPPGKEL